MSPRTLTPRERVLAALSHQEAPLAWIEMLFHSNVAAGVLGRVVAAIAAENPDPAAQVELCDQLGLCGVGVPVYARFGSHQERSEQSYHWVPHIVAEDDLTKLRFPELDRSELRATFRSARTSIGDRDLALYAVGMFCVSASMNDMGIENFCMRLHDDRRFVRKVMEGYAQYHAGLFEFLSEQPEIDLVWVFDDIAYKTSTFFSPRVFRQEILPIWREMVQCIHKPWIFHSDGNLEPVMDDLLTLGMSAIHPIENGAMDIYTLKSRIGGRVALVGNVDMGLLTEGRPAEVEETVVQLAAGLAEGGGYLLSSGNSISADVLTGNVGAMAAGLRRWNMLRWER